jgi:hypothetical protein
MTPVDAVEVERHLRIGSPASLTGSVARSYLSDGRCVAWVGPVPSGAAIAIDAELVDVPVPAALARRFGVDGFWRRWTRAECAAKLSGIPMATWLQRHGLDTPAPFTYTTVNAERITPNLLVSVAWAPEQVSWTILDPPNLSRRHHERTGHRMSIPSTLKAHHSTVALGSGSG